MSQPITNIEYNVSPKSTPNTTQGSGLASLTFHPFALAITSEADALMNGLKANNKISTRKIA